jgi:hypothetical protein
MTVAQEGPIRPELHTPRQAGHASVPAGGRRRDREAGESHSRLIRAGGEKARLELDELKGIRLSHPIDTISKPEILPPVVISTVKADVPPGQVSATMVRRRGAIAISRKKCLASIPKWG